MNNVTTDREHAGKNSVSVQNVYNLWADSEISVTDKKPPTTLYSYS
jgi:hypothetical protein